MTNEQWNKLIDIIDGKVTDQLPVGFIIDSPWLPNWADMSISDYFAHGHKWFDPNLKAIELFPDIIFLPGFWSEYGMCTEPSAFGAKCVWPENEFPSAMKIITDTSQIDSLTKPNPKTDGLCPFVLKRLHHYQPDIEAKGHAIKFAISRGPLNLASFLMGSTEFLIAMKTEPERIHKLLDIITSFMEDWIELQAETFPTIEGVLILDDIVGFLGEDDFKEFALPYLKRSFAAADLKVKFFHNDAQGLVCAPFLPEIGVDIFNFGFEHSIAEMKELTQNKVTLLGNIPPRDVLASGTVEDVEQTVKELVASLTDRSRVILSCGGGMPPGVPSENITAFLNAARQ